jgi:membrane protein
MWPRLEGWLRPVWRAALAGYGRGGTRLAAALTYYALLSPPGAADVIREPVTQIVAQRSSAGAVVGASVVVALWAASSYVGAFMWSVDRVYEVAKPASSWKLLVRRLLFALIILALFAVIAVAVVVGGPLARLVADAAGLGDAIVTAYRVLRWPLLFGAAVLLFFILYLAAPDVQRRGFRQALPGAVLGVAVWTAASAVFNLYVTHLGRYGATYGTLAGLVVFLLWIWILNLALLLGAEFNVQLGRLPARSP